MNKNISKKIAVLTMVFFTSSIFSCKKMFDITPKSAVDIENHYQNVYDANSAVLGLYGQLMGIAEQYIVLNELRADLMDITPKSDKYLAQISQHAVTADNPWADARPMFKIILNCNDIMQNFDIMVRDHKMSVDDYNQRYADVACVRAWVYLQLGIHFGNVPYVTDPIADVSALNDKSKFPLVNFDTLLDKLIASVTNLPFLDPYSAATTLTSGASSSLVTTVDNYATKFFFINKHYLLGDLYLWKGNYTAANVSYRSALEWTFFNLQGGNAANNAILRVSGTVFGVNYTRAQDPTSINASSTSGWQSMFIRSKSGDSGFTSATTPAFESEWYWQLNFDSNFAPKDPFIDLFSNQDGSWLVQPSQTAINNWNAQTQYNGFTYDERGNETYRNINGQNVIMKNLYVYQDATIQHKFGKWFLMRAAGLHLHFAEAANRDGRSKIGYALLNLGIRAVFDKDYTDPQASATANNTARDVTNNQQTFDVPPYDFDARQGRAPYPGWSQDWCYNSGVRSRANIIAYPVTLFATPYSQDLEDKLILEAGLELAYEGQRWPDLLRIALRRNDPSFIADKVYDKLSKDGYGAQASDARAKLMNRNYYLPLKL